MSSDTDLVIVAAVAANGVIGRAGEMPWHYPEDLAHFKSLTTGHPVIMGRKTYDSIAARLDGPLPDRTNIVLSRSALDLPDGAVRVGGIDEAVTRAAEHDDEAYIIGGATVYEAFIDRADRMVLTELDERYEGDTEFPAFGDEWVEQDRDEREAFAFVTYRRRAE